MRVRDVRCRDYINGDRVALVLHRSDGLTEIHFDVRPRMIVPTTKLLCDECGAPGFFNLCPTHRRLEDAAHGYPDDAA